MHIRVSRVTNHRFPKLNCGYAGNHHRGNLAIKSPPLYHHSVHRMHTLLSVSGELGRKKTVCLLGDAATIWYPSLKGKCLMQTQGAWRMKGQKWQLSPVPLRRKKRGKMSRGGVSLVWLRHPLSGPPEHALYPSPLHLQWVLWASWEGNQHWVTCDMVALALATYGGTRLTLKYVLNRWTNNQRQWQLGIGDLKDLMRNVNFEGNYLEVCKRRHGK